MHRKFEMAVHGLKAEESKLEGESDNFNALSDDQKKAMEIALKRAQERKIEEFKKRKIG